MAFETSGEQLEDDGITKRYIVVDVEHQLKHVALHEEQNVYIFVKSHP